MPAGCPPRTEGGLGWAAQPPWALGHWQFPQRCRGWVSPGLGAASAKSLARALDKRGGPLAAACPALLRSLYPPPHFQNAQQASERPPPQQPQAERSECVGQVRLEGLGAGPNSKEGAQSRWGQQAHVVHMRGALWGASPGTVPLAPPAQPSTAQ